jgi:hypothetical protein
MICINFRQDGRAGAYCIWTEEEPKELELGVGWVDDEQDRVISLNRNDAENLVIYLQKVVALMPQEE